MINACGDSGHRRSPTFSPSATPSNASSTPSPVASATPLAPSGVAWAAGGRHVLRSDDGGLTWSVALNAQVDALDFLDRDVGWVAAATTDGGHLYHTDDGGRHWRDDAGELSTPTPLFFDVAAPDAKHVVAVGSENGFLQPNDFHRGPPVIVVTNDGGATWRRATLIGVSRTASREIELLSACLTAGGIGLATGTDVTTFTETLVLLTRDFGSTWTNVTGRLPRTLFARAACTDDGHVWFGGGSTLMRSDDGGTTWVDLADALPADLNIGALTFHDPARGWLLAETFSETTGHRLLALNTVDGGGHWSEHLLATDTGEVGFGAIDFRDGHAVAVVSDLHPFDLERSAFALSFVSADGERWEETVHPEPINALWDVELLP